MKKLTIRDVADIAIVAAIYVVLTVTPPLNAISYGAYQFRISEMMNFMAFYNPKYIIGVTIGCMIANFFSFGLLDVFVGGGSTFSIPQSRCLAFLQNTAKITSLTD